MASKLKDKNIVLGVTAGIAAYKAVDLASKLTAAGACVECVMTANACQLIAPKSFEAITGRAVYSSMWNAPGDHRIEHISLTENADLIIVAPATANILGKIANGICDDLLSTLLCAGWDKPTLIAPAMNTKMWNNPAVQKNLETIKQMGPKFIGPESGRLACGAEGLGRMAEPADIINAAENLIA